MAVSSERGAPVESTAVEPVKTLLYPTQYTPPRITNQTCVYLWSRRQFEQCFYMPHSGLVERTAVVSTETRLYPTQYAPPRFTHQRPVFVFRRGDSAKSVFTCRKLDRDSSKNPEVSMPVLLLGYSRNPFPVRCAPCKNMPPRVLGKS